MLAPRNNRHRSFHSHRLERLINLLSTRHYALQNGTIVLDADTKAHKCFFESPFRATAFLWNFLGFCSEIMQNTFFCRPAAHFSAECSSLDLHPSFYAVQLQKSMYCNLFFDKLASCHMFAVFPTYHWISQIMIHLYFKNFLNPAWLRCHMLEVTSLPCFGRLFLQKLLAAHRFVLLLNNWCMVLCPLFFVF